MQKIKRIGQLITEYKEKIVFLIVALVIISFFCVHAEYKFDRTTDTLEGSIPIPICSGSYIEQEISNLTDGIVSSLNIEFGTYCRKNEGNVIVQFYENGNLIHSWNVMSSMLQDNSYYKFMFDSPVKINSSSVYKIHIGEFYEGENFVAVYTNADNGEIYNIDEERKVGSICFTLTYRNEQLTKIVIVISLFVVAVLIAMIFFKVNEIVIMSSLLLILLVSYIMTCPLGMAPDEVNHYLRAYEVANVSFISHHIGENGVGGNYLPSNLLAYFEKGTVLDKENLSEYSYGNTSLYSPISYLPLAIGIKVFGLFSNKVASIFWGGKCGNAFICYILCVLTIYLAPFGKRIFFLIMTFPLTLQEMISITPDGFTIVLCLFFIAYILSISYRTQKIKKIDMLILIIVGFLIALCKIVYVVLLLLLFMIPVERFSNRMNSYLFKIGLTGLALVLNLIWLKISTGFLIEFNVGVDSREQIKYILLNLNNYYVIVIRTITDLLLNWISTMIGSAMGALNIGITSITWFMAITLLLYETCSCFENDTKIHKWDCIILILTFMSGVILILTSLYVQWTPLKSEVIKGIQGRYFTPIIICLLLFIIFYRQKKINENGTITVFRSDESYSYLILLLYNGITLLDIIAYYI